MKILITGGAGFIGSHLVDRLVRNQAGKIVVLDNFSRGRIENLSQSSNQIQLIEGDIRNRQLLRTLMRGVNLVYHLAAQSNVLGAVQDIDYSFETNVIGTFEVLRAASEANVRRVVFSSSREVYGEPASIPVPETAAIVPKNAYGASKAAAEMYCRTFTAQGLETVILRLANVYGTRDRDRVIPLFCERALRGLPLTVFGRHKLLDFLWIDHLVDVLCAAAEEQCSHGPVNVGSGNGTTLVRLAERVSSLAERKLPIQVAQNRKFEVGGYVADVALARKHFNLKCPDDAIGNLPAVFEHMRHELLADRLVHS